MKFKFFSELSVKFGRYSSALLRKLYLKSDLGRQQERFASELSVRLERIESDNKLLQSAIVHDKAVLFKNVGELASKDERRDTEIGQLNFSLAAHLEATKREAVEILDFKNNAAKEFQVSSSKITILCSELERIQEILRVNDHNNDLKNRQMVEELNSLRMVREQISSIQLQHAELFKTNNSLDLSLISLKTEHKLFADNLQVKSNNLKNHLEMLVEGVKELENSRGASMVNFIGETSLNISKEFDKKVATELIPQIINITSAASQGANFAQYQLLTQQLAPDVKSVIEDTWSLNQYYEYFKSSAPFHFDTYMKCFNTGTESYESLPAQSCSTDAHAESLLFKSYLAPYLSGIVLDIGCGPQAVPSYLSDYPSQFIVGIDPLPETSRHPFTFIQAFAEKLPLKSSSVNTVVSATTLDHYYLLDKGLAEIHRVLKPGGFFVSWITHFEGAPQYDPYIECELPFDSEHMYHIDLEWFLPYISSKTALSKHHIIEISHPFKFLFMVFKKP